MKIVLFANQTAIIPVIAHFHGQNQLELVICPQNSPTGNIQIETLCQEFNIPFLTVTAADLKTTVANLFDKIQPDLAFICGFPYKLPHQLFCIPRIGCFNIHFSLLPAYRGPDPIFWQIRNGEQMGGITIHRVDEGFDSGEIVLQQPIPFMPGETWGICNSRHSSAVLNLVLKIIAAAEKKHSFDTLPNNAMMSYFPKPVTNDLTINWNMQTADEIENLVNACNPSAGGAITLFRSQQIRILEVSPVDGEGHENIAAGTIIHLDGNGLFVQCLDRALLRINIIQLFEGIVTGFKMAILGAKPGDHFENAHSMRELSIN